MKKISCPSLGTAFTFGIKVLGKQFREIIDFAVENRINYFDMSISCGTAEELLGNALNRKACCFFKFLGL